MPSRSVARDSYDTMQRGRNYSQRARTRLTQKALGFLHDAPGEQTGVGHLGGRAAQQSTGTRVREAPWRDAGAYGHATHSFMGCKLQRTTFSCLLGF